MNKLIRLSFAIALLTVASRPASSTELDDFSFEIKEYTGELHRAWVISKLTTIRVGSKCRAKMTDKKHGVVHAAAAYTRDIAEYAKSVTGDDWDRAEDQNREIAERMVAAFKSKFSLTIKVAGDDCATAEQSALWLRYWTTIGTALRDYPPKSGKAFITLEVTPKVKDVVTTVDRSGTRFRVVAPRDLEPPRWDDKIAKPFRRHTRN